MLLGAAALLTVCSTTRAETLRFSGYTWEVRGADNGGPGPNDWAPQNAWVDARGYLHLKVTHQGNKWFCPEVYSRERLGFGVYQFWIQGKVDQLDRNIVFGLFNYPNKEVGADGTNEIDIEFSRWGHINAPIGNYTVWPSNPKVEHKTHSFEFKLDNYLSTHRFSWSSEGVRFQSCQGLRDNDQQELANWLFKPSNPMDAIGQKPVPVHINLWCFEGKPPTDGKEVEMVIRAFKFVPQKKPN